MKDDPNFTGKTAVRQESPYLSGLFLFKMPFAVPAFFL
jgi:hypothetical protein